MIAPLKKILLTCLVIGQTLFATAQYYIHFDKDGKIEKVETTANVTDPKAYPSILSEQELRFEIDSVKIPKSSFWGSLQNAQNTLKKDTLKKLIYWSSLQKAQHTKDSDSLRRVRTATLMSLFTLLTDSKGALKYKPSSPNLPLQSASKRDVYKIDTTEYDHDLNKVPARMPLRLEGRDRIEYKLIRNKLDNDIIQKHLEATKKYYRGWSAAYDELLLELRQKFRNQGWEIDATLVRDSLQHSAGLIHPFNVGILDKLDPLAQPMELTDSLYTKVLKNNKQWIEAWLWYTGGEVRLNPFPYADPEKLIGRADREIKELESEIGAMANREVSQDEGGKKDRLAFLLSRLVTLKQAREELEKAYDEYMKWLAKLSVKSEVVYSGVWHGSDVNEIRWLHQFDAARNFRFMNAAKALPNMVANQDQVVIYTHNLSTDDKVVVSSTLTPFQPKSGIETTADAIAVELAKAVGGSSSIQGLAQLVAGLGSPSILREKPNNDQSANNSPTKAKPQLSDAFKLYSEQKEIKDLNSFIKNKFANPPSPSLFYDRSASEFRFTYESLMNGSVLEELTTKANSVLVSATNKVDIENAKKVIDIIQKLKNAVEVNLKARALSIMYDYFGVKDITAYNELIQSYVDSKRNLIWLSAQTVPILSLNLKPDEKPIYRTHTEFPEKKVAIESSNKVAYTLTLNEKTPVARQTYAKYFTSRFMPSFGIVYIPGQRSALRFDETTGQFKPLEKDFDHIEALVGAKFYLWKTNPARTDKTRYLLRKAFSWKANWDRGNHLLNTFYVSGGLGVRRQLLRNYYLGLGVDIIPGLSIQAGSNFVFQKQYELENAKIKSETEVLKPFGYVGLGLDLGLVTNLIKILIP